MRRTAAVILGTAALLGVLAAPASAAPGGGTVDTTVAAVTATAGNAIVGVQSVISNATAGL
ncbi:hypothetical protein ACWGKW_22775 [Streptomyces sp. NPDC054766]|uniref:hypothetical protein n=1 Tax=Streptomyces rhizosphaerihabitans TaxID=1266770 RepID=UPI0021BFA2B5|nr:hypothetical protein [Streptomyces rhizosphaerihabitans]MCT9008745.1 hypothetical protein [Streptomyces rhizosphaerihabitans]